MIDEKADCYSAGERGAMIWFQRLRARALAPLLTWLDRCRVSANHLTLLSVVGGLLFVPLYLAEWNVAAFVVLALHVLLDGLDGPLARHRGDDSRSGSFTDSLADQIVLAATTAAAMSRPDHLIGVLAGLTYVFCYTLVVGFAMVRNALGIPYSWLVRPRFLVYAWLALECFAWRGGPLQGSINVFLWLLNVMLAWKVFTGFVRIQRRLR